MKLERYVLFAIALFLAMSCGASKVNLRFNPQKEKTYKIKMTMDQKIEQKVMGEQQDIEQVIAITYSFDVLNVTENEKGKVTEMKITFDGVYYKQAMSGVVVEYDSENPPDDIPPSAAGFAALPGASFSMTMNRSGKTENITGVDEMIEKMVQKMNIPPGPVSDQAVATLKKSFNEKGLAESMDQMMHIYPDKAVGIGDSWSKEIKLNQDFPMILDSTWKIVAIEAGVAKIDVTSKAKPYQAAEPILIGNMKMYYTLRGTQTGTLEMDQETGWTIRARVIQKFSGDIELSGVPGSNEKISWPIKIDSIVTFEPVE